MAENIESDFAITKVERMKRRGAKGELESTHNIKVTVEGSRVPKSVKIFGCNFRAELYVFPVRQCKNCWGFGHGAKFCTSRTRCRSCGGNHATSDCNRAVKCPNCKRNHNAEDPQCPEKQRRHNIHQAMKEKQITFKQAETHFPRLENRFSLLEDSTEEPFPRLDDGAQEEQCSGGRNDAHKSGSGTPRSRRTSRERQHPDDTTTLPRTTPPREPCLRCLENPHKATEFEKVIAWLRQEFLTVTRAKRWLVGLRNLQLKIAQRIHQVNSELDRDHLLVEIGSDLQEILDSNIFPAADHTRTNQRSHSGV